MDFLAEKENKMVAIFIIIGTIYFLPTIIAIARGHKQTVPIFSINLLLGTTLVFWVVAFVWATMRSD